jgi:ATP-dependent exoDNAse (exonuclease V) beta subunit
MYKTLLNEKYMKEEIEEKIRLFYVALTRCKEKMIMIADLDSKDIFGEKDKDGLVELSSRLSYRSFRDIILSVKDNLVPFIKNIDINDYHLSHDYNIWHTNNYQKRIPISNIEIDKRSINIDSKPIEELSYSKKVNKLIDIETKDSIDKGLFFHYCLETLDLKRPNLDHLNGFYQQKIISFLNQDLLKNIQASKIYKEYEFIYVDNDVEHHGIIDLMLEFEDHIKIIDYKFKYIDKDDYDNQLKGYQKYIESITNKRVELYLYSIMDEKYRMVS